MQRDVLIFETAGHENTDATLKAACRRAGELGLKRAVVATSTGSTLLKALEAFKDTKVRLIGVTLNAGLWKKYAAPDPEKISAAREAGARVLTATHPLMGNLGSAICDAFGGLTPGELMARAYYTIAHGVAVGIQASVMAADAGLVSPGEEIVAVAGTGRGADTALVLTPAFSVDFFALKVHEIIAMPR
jgi:hypothetical protein